MDVVAGVSLMALTGFARQWILWGFLLESDRGRAIVVTGAMARGKHVFRCLNRDRNTRGASRRASFWLRLPIEMSQTAN